MKVLSSFFAMSYAKDANSSNFHLVLQKPINRFISDLKSLAPCECAGSIAESQAISGSRHHHSF
jgi:hypothetical protein